MSTNKPLAYLTPEEYANQKPNLTHKVSLLDPHVLRKDLLGTISNKLIKHGSWSGERGRGQ